jgi:hypothetical protein
VLVLSDDESVLEELAEFEPEETEEEVETADDEELVADEDEGEEEA